MIKSPRGGRYNVITKFHFIFPTDCLAANLFGRLANASGKAAIDAVPHHVMFPSIHDAVISAVRARDYAVS